MATENPRLGITENEVEGSIRHAETHDTSDLYAESMLMQMEADQSELRGFIALYELDGEISHKEIFRLGAGWAYDQIPLHHKRKPLTTGELTVVQRSLAENARLKTSEVFDSTREKMDFMLGAMLVAIPFYMRGEAEALEQRFK